EQQDVSKTKWRKRLKASQLDYATAYDKVVAARTGWVTELRLDEYRNKPAWEAEMKSHGASFEITINAPSGDDKENEAERHAYRTANVVTAAVIGHTMSDAPCTDSGNCAHCAARCGRRRKRRAACRAACRAECRAACRRERHRRCGKTPTSAGRIRLDGRGCRWRPDPD